MKINFNNLLILFLFLFLSCGSDSDSIEDENNTPPSTPSLVTPENGLFCIDNTIDFQFTASSDVDGDSILYEIEFSTDPTFSEIEILETSNSILNTYILPQGLNYYWRVRAKDTKNAYSTYSSVFSFFTQSEGISNNLPFNPTLNSPLNDSDVNSENVLLSWDAVDIDGDNLSFDIYLDTQNPPQTLVAENMSNTSITVNLDQENTFHWYVVVKDGNGGETIGQVWRFTTN